MVDLCPTSDLPSSIPFHTSHNPCPKPSDSTIKANMIGKGMVSSSSAFTPMSELVREIFRLSQNLGFRLSWPLLVWGPRDQSGSAGTMDRLQSRGVLTLVLQPP